MQQETTPEPSGPPSPGEHEHWLATTYENACHYLALNLWEEALDQLEQITQVEPHYRDSAQLASQAWRQVRLVQAYSRGVDSLKNGEVEAAMGYLSWVVSCCPDHLDALARLREAQQQARLAEMYRRGLNYYTERRWDEAVEIFAAVIAAEPGYRHALGMLQDSRQQLALASARSGGPEVAQEAETALARQLEGLYNQAQKRLQAEEWTEAEESLQQIAGLQGSYRDADQLLERARLQGQLASLYNQATQAWKRGQRAHAVMLFEQIMDLDPEYRDVAKRLQKLR